MTQPKSGGTHEAHAVRINQWKFFGPRFIHQIRGELSPDRTLIVYHSLGQGSRSYASCTDLFAEAQLAHLNKTTSCEFEVATGQPESDVIRVAAGALQLGR